MQFYILFVVCIKSNTYFGLFYFVDHNSAFQTCVVSNLTYRSFDGMTNQVHAGLYVSFCFDGIKAVLDVQEGCAAADPQRRPAGSVPRAARALLPPRLLAAPPAGLSAGWRVRLQNPFTFSR